MENITEGNRGLGKELVWCAKKDSFINPEYDLRRYILLTP